MIKSVKKFKKLHGAVVSRKQIQRIIDLAKTENQTDIIYRLSKVMNDNPDQEEFQIQLKEYPAGLNAARHQGAYKSALDECGRLLPGFKFENGSVVKVEKKKPVKRPAKPVAKKTTKPEVKEPEIVKPVRRKSLTKSQFLKLLRADSKKEYDTKHDYIKGYLAQEKQFEGYQQRLIVARETENYKDADNIEAAMKELSKAMDLQVDQGAKAFKLVPVDFISVINLYTENPTEIKKAMWPAEDKKTTPAKLKPVTDKKQLDEINPKPFANKPKSVSVATAIEQVLATGKYPGIKPMQANVLFTVLKGVEELESDEEITINASNFQNTILNGIAYRYIYYSDDWTKIELHAEGVKLINAIRGRIDSLKKQKTNYAMFPLNGSKKPKGLKAPVVEQTVPAKCEKPAQPVNQISNFRPGSIADRRQQRANQVRQYYKIDNPELKRFLGDVEIKEKESVVITVASEQGGGKSRFLFQCIEAFGKNYRPGHASMEEHPDSSLYEDKANEYLSPEVHANLVSPEINSYADIEKLIAENDVIFIDSWAKLQEMYPKIGLDKDLRKKYDGKLFIIIYQLTSDGKMRGGSASQYDGDIILFGGKSSDYKENKIITNKNRYNNIPACDLQFNIYTRKCLVPEAGQGIEAEKQEPEPQPAQPASSTGLMFRTV
jgi:hypothetical protein